MDRAALHARDAGLIPGSERSPREGNDNPLQYSCQGKPMDKGYSSWGLKEPDVSE